VFISFEGIDFSGKSTQISRIVQWLRADDHKVVLVREPGGTEISERIRSILLDTRYAAMHPITELFLFSAARAQLVGDIIRPALAEGAYVIADRFLDSTTVYQGYGRGLDVEQILSVHEIATQGIQPDLTIVLDVDVEESMARREANHVTADRMETADKAFFERVRTGYYDLTERFSYRFRIVDAMRPIDDITKIIIHLINTHRKDTA